MLLMLLLMLLWILLLEVVEGVAVEGDPDVGSARQMHHLVIDVHYKGLHTDIHLASSRLYNIEVV